MSVTVAVVGCGAMGRKRVAALRPQDRVVAVHDPISKRAQELAEHTGATVCDDRGALLDVGADVAIVSTTPEHLAPTAIAALERGCHVLVEKPIASTHQCAVELCDAARVAGRVLFQGTNLRWFSSIKRMSDLISTGAVGDLFGLRAQYGHGGRAGYEREWRFDRRQSGGGELLDQGYHLIDLARMFLGDLELRGALCTANYWSGSVEDNATVLLAGPSGCWAALQASWTEWRNSFVLELYGTDGKLTVKGLGGSYGECSLTSTRRGGEVLGLELPAACDLGASFAMQWQAFVARLAGGPMTEAELRDVLFPWQIIDGVYQTLD